MNKRQKIILFLSLMILPLIILLIAQKYLPNTYLFSSIYKLIYLTPFLYTLYVSKKKLKTVFNKFSLKTFKNNFFKMFFLGILAASIYLSAFYLFKGSFDLSLIQSKLQATLSITTTNLIFIGLYIIIINSLLEEFFWRGFMFDKLNSLTKPITAHLLTGIAFSFHHVIFYYAWFDVTINILITFGLVFFAIFMNLVYKKYHDLFSCWLIHAIADIAQIFIGFKIFGII